MNVTKYERWNLHPVTTGLCLSHFYLESSSIINPTALRMAKTQ